MTGTQLLAVLLAGAAGGFAWLAIALATGTGPTLTTDANDGIADRLLGRLRGRDGQLLVLAGVAGLGVVAVTGWLAVGVGAVVMILAWPQMFGAARAQQLAIARLEALATWVESLRDTIATGLALPEAIMVSSQQSPALLRRPLQDLVARMQAREPLDRALIALADDLDDAVADQTGAALALNARVQGRQLKAVLSSLAESTRKQVDARRQVEADRRSTRQGTRIIMVVTALFVVGLSVLNREYVEPFHTATGQLVLAVAVGCFAAGFAYMHRLSSFSSPTRFLTAAGSTTAAAAGTRTSGVTAASTKAGVR